MSANVETMIYLRTSTEEQNPENQLKDCLSINEYGGHQVIQDKQSAWKEKDRKGFEELKKLISSRKCKHVIVWDLDRVYRNRKNLIGFFQFAKAYGCQIHSFRQQWLESLNKIQPPFNEIMFDLMLQIMGWLAEEESSKKSERVKAAIRKKAEGTYSRTGKKWGRKGISTQKINQIIAMRNQGDSIRSISKELNLSIGVVHKTLSEIPTEKTVIGGVH